MTYFLVGIASLGGLLFGYETGVSAGALHAAEAAWAHAPNEVSLSTVTLLGAVLGALAAGRIADMSGRRDVIMATTALFTLGSFVSAVAPNGTVLIVGRLVVGVGVGAISLAAPLYIAEIAPTAQRGRLICVFQLMITIGILLAYLGADAMRDTPDGWRYLLLAGALPGLLLSGLALLLIESPVWLALEGDQQSAIERLRGLGRDSSVPEIEELGSIAFDDQKSDGLAQVFSLAGRGAIFIGIGLFFIQQFVGINAVIYYSTESLSDLFEPLGLGLINSALGLAVVNVAATVGALVLIDRVGRRRLLLIGLTGVAIALIAMAGGASLQTSRFDDILSVAGFYLFFASFAMSIGPIAWVAAAELLPIRVRGLAMGVVVASHWLFDSLASPTGPLLRTEFGRPALFLLYAGVAVTGILIFRRIMPETKGLSLPDIDRYFTDWASRVKESRFVHYSVATLATMGGLLGGYNFAITGVALVLIADDWNLSAFQQGALVSALVVGVMVGAFIAGRLSDRFGRRYVLMSMAALFVASAFFSGFAPSLGWLVAARVAAGFAIGVTSPTAGLYVAEVAPASIRGRMLSFVSVAYGLGAILAYCVGLALENAADGWRHMLEFIAVPSTIYGLALLPLPESPRWLAAVGQLNAARRSLVRLVGSDADKELAAITAEQPGSEPDRDATHGRWSQLLQPRYRPAVRLGLALMFLFVFSGWEMVPFYAPTILKKVGFADNTVSIATTLGIGTVSLIAMLVSLNIIDRVGRKPMVVIGLFAMAASLLVMASLTVHPLASTELARWGQAACLAIFAGTFTSTLGLVSAVVISEMYPQSVRGPASSLAWGVRDLFSIVFTLTFPLVLHVLGLGITLVGFAAIGIAGALYLLHNLPETKGRSLEEIAAGWDRDRHVPALFRRGGVRRGRSS